MISIMVSSSSKKYSSKYSIVEGKYVATDVMCRWGTVFLNGELPIGLPEIPPQLYENGLKIASGVYPLLLPFGTTYLLLNVEMNNDSINLYINSFYNDSEIPVDYLGLLTYLAIEIIRKGCYNRDDFLKVYKPYYDKIKEKIPEKYEILVNGEFASVDFKVLYDLIKNIVLKDFFSNPPQNKCVNCPLRRICPFGKGLIKSKWEEYTRFPLIMEDEDIYFSFKNAHIDYILFSYLSFFKYYSLRRVDRRYSMQIKYMNEYSNKAILLSTEIILCLKDGKLYYDVFTLKNRYPDIRIFGKNEDVTKKIIYREIARKSLIENPPCNKLEEYLSKNYSKKDRNLFYLTLLNFSLKNPIENPIFFLKTVYDSKLYEHGLLNIDNSLTLYPTKRMLEIMKTLCGDDIK